MMNPTTWEEAAEAALTNMGVDMPGGTQQSYRELYDLSNYAGMASKAMHELNESDKGSWTLAYQVELLASKQHDYGHENINRFGVRGVEVRLWDKVSRYENLMKRHGTAMNEGVADTLKDIIGYCAILEMLRFNWFGLPLGVDIEGN